MLVLVLDMKAKDYESFRTKVNPLLGVSLPEGGTLPRFSRRVSGFINFAADWKPSFFRFEPPVLQVESLHALSDVLQVRAQTRFRKVWPRMAASAGFAGASVTIGGTTTLHTVDTSARMVVAVPKLTIHALA